MTNLTHLAQTMQTLLTTTAKGLARKTGFVIRESKCTGSKFAQALTFGFMHQPTSSLEGLCQTALRADLEISPQGLDQRFTPQAARFMQALFEAAACQIIQGEAVLIPVLQRFSQVLVLDSSVISLPPSLKDEWAGCGVGQAAKVGQVEANAALKVHLQFDLCRGGLVGVALGAGREHDSQAAIAQANRAKDTLSLRDLAYFNLSELDQTKPYSLSRYKAGIKLISETGQSQTMSKWLAAQNTERIDQWVKLGQQEQVKVRLLAARVPASVAEQRRQKLKAEAKREGKAVSAERLALSEWQVYVTNVPQALLSLEEGLSLGRSRWQIELVFKEWKSQGQIDEWRSEKPSAILCELYAKLLASVIKHWIVITASWSYPERSMVKAGQVVRQAGREMASALGKLSQLVAVLEIIERGLIKGCKLNKRKNRPNNYQILLEPNLGYYKITEVNNPGFAQTMLA